MSEILTLFHMTRERSHSLRPPGTKNRASRGKVSHFPARPHIRSKTAARQRSTPFYLKQQSVVEQVRVGARTHTRALPKVLSVGRRHENNGSKHSTGIQI